MRNYQIFKKPYVLIEDVKNKFQPFYKEYTATDPPKLRLNSPTLCCPFAANKKYKPSSKKRSPKGGFCEICYVKFSDYNSHVMEFEHREFAKDNINYKKLDAFIASYRYEEENENECLNDVKMTPIASSIGKSFSTLGSYKKAEKYPYTLHFSKISTDSNSLRDAVAFDNFLAEMFN